MLSDACGITPTVLHGPPRPGDVRDSLADISAATATLGFTPAVHIENGLAEYTEWAREEVRRAEKL